MTMPPSYVGCPRARTDMTPCVARDGTTAMSDEARCVGCDLCPADLLRDLVREVTAPYHFPSAMPVKEPT